MAQARSPCGGGHALGAQAGPTAITPGRLAGQVSTVKSIYLPGSTRCPLASSFPLTTTMVRAAKWVCQSLAIPQRREPWIDQLFPSRSEKKQKRAQG